MDQERVLRVLTVAVAGFVAGAVVSQVAAGGDLVLALWISAGLTGGYLLATA